jgi:hypothetical protein
MLHMLVYITYVKEFEFHTVAVNAKFTMGPLLLPLPWS